MVSLFLIFFTLYDRVQVHQITFYILVPQQAYHSIIYMIKVKRALKCEYLVILPNFTSIEVKTHIILVTFLGPHSFPGTISNLTFGHFVYYMSRPTDH